MSNLIDRQKAIDIVEFECGEWSGLARTIVKAIKQLPSAQPEIIWCKDCVHHIDGFFCRQANHHTSDKDHCASVFRAERRTDEQFD